MVQHGPLDISGPLEISAIKRWMYINELGVSRAVEHKLCPPYEKEASNKTKIKSHYVGINIVFCAMYDSDGSDCTWQGKCSWW